jgi:hypothetical protein
LENTSTNFGRNNSKSICRSNSTRATFSRVNLARRSESPKKI